MSSADSSPTQPATVTPVTVTPVTVTPVTVTPKTVPSVTVPSVTATPASVPSVPVPPVSLPADARSLIELEPSFDSAASNTRAKTLSSGANVHGQESLPPKPKDARYELLDIVRGMACLMLMLYHATFYAEHSWVSSDSSTWTLGGLAINLVGRLWIGVPMFFIVSGYCIAASIDSLRRKPYSLSNFVYRRLRRIYPPLWGGLAFAVVFTLIVSLDATLLSNCLQLPRLNQFTSSEWLSNFSATTSWLPSTLGSESAYLMANTWTLCYEEQFYFVTGLLLVLASRRFFLACYLVAALTLFTKHACRVYDIPVHGFFFDGHWLLFACGILVYQRINYLKGAPAKWATMTLILGAVHGLAERILAVSPDDRHFGEYLLVACLFALCLSYIKPWDSRISNHWTLSLFRSTGRISYSLYLIHFPITVFTASVLATAGIRSDGQVFLVTIPVCMLFSVPIAYVFFLLVERPFINKSSETKASIAKTERQACEQQLGISSGCS